MRDELYHSGIPGMKWGVRRYQNEDGTLTEAGKRRYAKTGQNNSYYQLYKKTPKSSQKGPSRSDKFFAGTKNKNGNYNNSPAKSMVSDAAQMARETRSAGRTAGRLLHPGASSEGMTDAELRSAINRLEMERRYRDLTAGDCSAGAAKVDEILSLATSVLTIGSLGLGIYATARGIKNAT